MRSPAGTLEGFELAAPVLQGNDAPTTGLEYVVEPIEHPVRCRRVERLPVIINDPPAVSHVVLVGESSAKRIPAR